MYIRQKLGNFLAWCLFSRPNTNSIFLKTGSYQNNLGIQLLLTTFQIIIILSKRDIVKMCSNFTISHSNCLTRYLILLLGGAYGYKHLLNFNCHTMKFYKLWHAIQHPWKKLVHFTCEAILWLGLASFLKINPMNLTSCTIESSVQSSVKRCHHD